MIADKKISNIKRLRQIINAFVKHGLGDLVKMSGLGNYISMGKRLLFMKDPNAVKYTRPQRMAMVFEELGPTFIKLGQILSSRKDQLPLEFIREFEKLRDNAAPIPYDLLDNVFIEEFGQSMEQAFASIDRTPLATASIGQVHAARLKTGEDVVVKIRKPGIEHIIRADVKILYFLANRIKAFLLKNNNILNPAEIVAMFEGMIENELDFVLEGRNIERFSHNFRDDPLVHFPAVYWNYSSRKILVMQKIEGVPISEVELLKNRGHDLEKISHTLFHLTLKQMFDDAFFHADPHPGNFIIMDNGVIGVIDCGMVGMLDEAFVNSFVDCFVGIFVQNYDLVVRGYMSIGTLSSEVDEAAFKVDIRNFADHCMRASYDNKNSIAGLVDNAIAIGVKHKMKIPAPMLFTSRALILVEGTIRKLSPQFDFVGNSTSLARTLVLKKKFDPRKLASDSYDFFAGIADMVRTLPRQTSKILSAMEEQRMKMNVGFTGLEELYRRMDTIGGCIALGVISSGLAIGGSLVIHARIAPLWYGISLFGMFGYVLAVIIGLWVVFLFERRGR